MALSVVILAAGKGTRMKSAVPKVLHELAGKPLLEHVYDTAKDLGAEEIVIVYGHGGDQVKERCNHFDAIWVEQKEQLGTGHAVQHGLDKVNKNNDVLVLYGDVPLTEKDSLQSLLEISAKHIALMTVDLDHPFGYGRIVRDGDGNVLAIVEEKDASEDERAIHEVNTGILAAKATILDELIAQIDNDNSQGEYYLTDIFSLAANKGIKIETCQPAASSEVEGINDRIQLAKLERIFQRNCANKLMRAGVSLIDPNRIDIRGQVEIAEDVTIDVNVVLSGSVKIERGVTIGPNCIISNTSIAKNVTINANTVIEDAVIDENVEIGPFARIRPETHLQQGCKVGNFVEIKKSNIGIGSKVNHLTYIGDTEMGSGVNIGAGTITCNYDGANKHKTIIEDDVFIGSNSQLVAPVVISRNTTVAAGATITKDTEEDSLVISRAPQKSIKNWNRPKKSKH